jgi:hypothetical protein
MAPPTRPPLSISLPPSFEFHYRDGLPQTPDQQDSQDALNVPPPPRPQAYKIRRKRAAIPDFQEHKQQQMLDTAIPTIEMSEAVSEMSSPHLQPTPSSHPHGLLAPLPAIQRLVTPPKTPAPRFPLGFNSPMDSPANEWDMINNSRDMQLKTPFERSGSVCSSFSDSSVSSCGSSAFSAPNNGCTSPESEATDPFLEDDIIKGNEDKSLLSPEHDRSPRFKRIKTHRHIKWTPAMDDHLWLTYMTYLSDPRFTPFKMLPGTVPPLGVCTRVASKARRTWNPHRVSTPSFEAVMTSDRMLRDGSPDTIRPDGGAKATQWPRSDSATRKRLRKLCKRNTSLPSYYHRLLRTRSPSPFTSSSTAERSSEPPAPAAFSSRDLNVSLVAATADSMQPKGPLAQLSSDDTPVQRPQTASQHTSRPADWFARIPRSQAHQKSLSLQSGLNLTGSERPSGYLASPFDDTANRTHLLQSMNTTQSLGRSAFHKDGQGPSLDSPVELSGAPTAPRSLKRRFKSDEEKPKRPALHDVFGPQSDDAVIVRNRGFTVGAVRATDNLAKLSQPAPAAVDQDMAEAPAVPPVPALPSGPGVANFMPLGARSAPRRLAEPVPRLGSPFTEAPNRQFNTFPRSYIPTTSNPQPFQQRLRELAAQGAAGQRSG